MEKGSDELDDRTGFANPVFILLRTSTIFHYTLTILQFHLYVVR
ncbi:hypothetical protein [Pedobacter aquatilis]|nr:hypothetical protein [Pedobacter aquatilis]